MLKLKEISKACLYELEVNYYKIFLLYPKTLANKSTGLLNHLSLSPNEGLCFNTKLLHCFNMKFPITIMGFDKHFIQCTNAILAQPDTIIILPYNSKYVIEISHEIYNSIIIDKSLKNIKIINGLSAKCIYIVFKNMIFLVILFLVILFPWYRFKTFSFS